MIATLRPMTMADLATVVVLEKQIFDTDAWPRQVFARDLRHGQRPYIVAESEGVVIGYAGLWMTKRGAAEISNIAVAPDFRGQGLGSRLMEALLAIAEAHGVTRVGLTVRVSNSTAQAMYRKYGFENAELREGYYPDDGEDAWWMVRETKPQP